MTATNVSVNREILPRWRQMGATIALGELDSLTESRPISFEEAQELEDRRAEWLANRSLSFAVEYASTAVVTRRPEVARDAAEFVLQNSSLASAAALSVANRVIASASEPAMNPVSYSGEADQAVAKLDIKNLRRRLRREPRNAVAWVDLARAHAVLGQLEKGHSSMRVALELAPENRFILRAGSTFLVIRGEPDLAHSLLLRANATREDPWLVAAEIAVAGMADRRPQLVRPGRSIVESGTFPPRHTSELASALGTLELHAGQSRRARKLFELALRDPNENSLAQAEWASRLLPNLDLSEHDLTEPNAFEARARHDSDEGHWKEAVQEAWNWHSDQPFVRDASVFGSYAAALGLMDFEEAARLARAGLDSNPGDTMLLNNLAYALLELGDTEDAMKSMRQIKENQLEAQHRAVFTATRGLLAYKQGEPERGLELYRSAIGLARRAGWVELAAMAALILVRQEMSAGGDALPDAVKQALELSEGVKHSGVRTWRERLLDHLGSDGRPGVGRSLV